LVFVDRTSLEIVQTVGVSSKSVVRTVWHPTLNQIFVGCSDAKTYVLYSPELSKKGVLMSVGRKARAKDASDFVSALDVVNPHSLPLFKEMRNKRKQHRKDMADPVKSKRPQPPLVGVTGAQGRISDQSAQHFLMKGIIAKKPRREEDPREALLRYEEKAKSNPEFFGKAYAKTQPKPILDYEGAEEEARKYQQLTQKQIELCTNARPHISRTNARTSARVTPSRSMWWLCCCHCPHSVCVCLCIEWCAANKRLG
jgi:WD repeat-containing protein 70